MRETADWGTMGGMTEPTQRTKGRPRAFDRAVALERALGVFWQRGYEPSTIAELCKAMEIKPPSLYAAFGNKAQLFLEAVRHYETVYWDAAWLRMQEDPDVFGGLARFFGEAAAILTSQDAPCGCMVILGAINVSPDAQDVTDAVRLLREEGRTLFLRRLKRAVKAGQLPRGTDSTGLAATLNALLEGMSVQARDGATQAELERIGKTAMRLVPHAA